MARIKVLDRYTANRIAAGEVVERPASVVKELLENSLDAGATSISIETDGGGLNTIKVTDDGCGIPADEAETAFLRHATSKISDSDDLAHIETLGFRGEALASIAAVSRVEMRTKTEGAEAGRFVYISSGDVTDRGLAGMPTGTSISVNELFMNVPARLKFVKSARAEAAYISDYVSRMIMARPEVAFHLVQGEKTVYRSTGDGSLKNAIYCVYGADVLQHIRELSFDDGYCAITGFVGTERIGRANRTAQSVYVNGRYIKSQKLSFALQRAYDTRLMTGRFPFAVINISINSAEVDVNVHPNKLDVRFRDEERIMRAVVSAARNALARVEESDIPADEAWPSFAAPKREETPRREAQIYSEPAQTNRLTLDALPASAFTAAVNRPAILHDSAYEAKAYPSESPRPEPIAREIVAEPVQTAISASSARIIGCVFDCYWIVSDGDGVFFIDQHAMHERALYERIVREGVNHDSQLLLVPSIVKLTPMEFDTLMGNLPAFEELGFDISEFGPLTVSIRAVPSIMGAPQTEAFLMDAIEALDKRNRLSSLDMKRAALIRSACKHAIKAGERPDKSEIEALLALYEKDGIPMTCPHGRPVMVRMSKLELEKLFKRVL